MSLSLQLLSKPDASTTKLTDLIMLIRKFPIKLCGSYTLDADHLGSSTMNARTDSWLVSLLQHLVPGIIIETREGGLLDRHHLANYADPAIAMNSMLVIPGGAYFDIGLQKGFHHFWTRVSGMWSCQTLRSNSRWPHRILMHEPFSFTAEDPLGLLRVVSRHSG